MNLHLDDSHPAEDDSFSEFHYDEDRHELPHKRHVRRMLEDKLERRRFKQELSELDELDGEFDWDDVKD